MITQRKMQIILALLVSSVFLFQNCATFILGTHQKIPVTSSPTGAKILVDGKEMGFTPLNLKLKNDKGYIIRIEKQGYNPFEIRITQKASVIIVSMSIFRFAFVSVLGAAFGEATYILYAFGRLLLSGFTWEPEFKSWPIWAGAIVGGLSYLIWEFSSGPNYTLSPKELNVTLTKIEGNAQPDFILIDAEQLQNINWIRIKCTDNNKEEIINLD